MTGRVIRSDREEVSSAIGFGMLKLVRLYTFNSPIRRGKLRLSRLAMRLSKFAPRDIIVSTVDGRRLYADLATGMCESLFFQGEYERAVTRVITTVVERGDVCLDVGANFGWYATLLRDLCGTNGSVHAFEPVPETFKTLEKNVGLGANRSNVHINNVALGDRPGNIEMHVFAGLPNGHSSISAMGRSDYKSVASPMITLDSYLTENCIEKVDFIKVDVEGAELMLLKGAEKLFKQAIPPIWMMEMALGTTREFGYFPDELIQFLRVRADYEFYAVEEPTGTLKRIEGFALDDIGANVLCLPSVRYGSRFERARKSLGKMTKRL
jgi:FkbM family methyltransferase